GLFSHQKRGPTIAREPRAAQPRAPHAGTGRQVSARLAWQFTGRPAGPPQPTRTTMSETPPAWHAQEPAHCFARLDADPAGLTGAQADERLRRHGPNRLPQGRRAGPLLRF